jgi:hypothetical protein
MRGFDESIEIYGDVELSLRAKEFGQINYLPSLLVQTSSRDIDGFDNLVKYLRRFAVAIYSIEVISKPANVGILDLETHNIRKAGISSSPDVAP